MRIFLALFLTAGLAIAQQAPQQLINNASGFRDMSSRDMEMVNTYLLSVLVGMGAVSPASLLGNAAGFRSISDRDLQNIQTYLLSTFAGSVVPNAQSTNNGVLSTNGNNILISPTNTISVFTNAAYAIAIGANFPIGSVLGNGIWIGGGGGGAGGSVGTNSIAIGGGAGAAGVNPEGTYNSLGAIAIGQQVDNFGPGGIAIGNNSLTFLSSGSFNSMVIGNSSSDNGSAVTNFAIFGHNFSSPANNTWYFGNGPAGGTNQGRIRNFVFMTGKGYIDDGAIIGNGWGLTNVGKHWFTNSAPLGAATVTISATNPQIVFVTNAAFAFGGIANLTGDGVVDSGEIWVSNSAAATITATFGNGWRFDKPNTVAGSQTVNSTWGLTNGTGYSHATWWAMSGSFSNIQINARQ